MTPDWLAPALALAPGAELDAVFAERCLGWTNKQYRDRVNRYLDLDEERDNVFVSTDPAASARYVRAWLRERGLFVQVIDGWDRKLDRAVVAATASTRKPNGGFEELAYNGIAATWEHALVRLALVVAARGEGAK
jgi:hypothetical protein